MYKRSLSHLLTCEHSGTVRGMLTCWHTFTLTHVHAIPGSPLDSFATSANPPSWSFSAETSGQLVPESAHPAAGARGQTGR